MTSSRPFLIGLLLVALTWTSCAKDEQVLPSSSTQDLRTMMQEDNGADDALDIQANEVRTGDPLNPSLRSVDGGDGSDGTGEGGGGGISDDGDDTSDSEKSNRKGH